MHTWTVERDPPKKENKRVADLELNSEPGRKTFLTAASQNLPTLHGSFPLDDILYYLCQNKEGVAVKLSRLSVLQRWSEMGSKDNGHV